MKEEKQLTPEQIYKRNQKISKALKVSAPICFWGFLVLSIFCLVLAIKNSFGNIAEILALLDSEHYTGEQLKSNYDFLISKYGEWVIGTGANGFVIKFVNIGNAVFSGFFVINLILFIIFLVSAFVLGKWALPKIANQIQQDNQDMVNLQVLRNTKE